MRPSENRAANEFSRPVNAHVGLDCDPKVGHSFCLGGENIIYTRIHTYPEQKVGWFYGAKVKVNAHTERLAAAGMRETKSAFSGPELAKKEEKNEPGRARRILHIT